MSLPDIEPGQRGFLQPGQMRLDFENPRLAAHKAGGELDEVGGIHELLLHADLMELVETIAANGFINFEPLIVLRESDHYRVLEGNRRLAAVKLLSNRDWAKELNVSIPSMDSEVVATLGQIEVQAVASREEARQFIGFKHINGPHKWDSYAKGKFAADWYRSEEGLSLRDISRRLGDRHDTIQRLVQGIYVLEQAEREGLFDRGDRYNKRPFAFSHLYTALTRVGYRRYLGLPEEWRRIDPEPDPIAEENLPKLAKVLSWLYGSGPDDEAPVVTSQNPHLKQLGEVLENDVALQTLEAERSLPMAYSEVMTTARKFSEAMVKALQAAERAQQNIYDFDKRDRSMLQIAERLSRVADSIVRQVRMEFESADGNEEEAEDASR